MTTGKYIISILLLVCSITMQAQEEIKEPILIAVRGNRVVQTFTDYDEAIAFFSKRPNFKGTLYNVSNADVSSFIVIVPTDEEVLREIEEMEKGEFEKSKRRKKNKADARIKREN